MSPPVSVILPARNCGRYLKEAVDSVLNQSFRDFELILVNDHGADGSVESLPANDRRLKIIANQGDGIVDALNTGAAAAEGEYLARMDGDDICEPRRLERQLDYLERNSGVSIAGTRVRMISGGGVDEGYRIYEAWINSLVAPEEIARSIFIESPLPHPTVMMRREVFEKLGGYRDMGWPEDYDLWLRAFESGERMGKAPEILLRWRDTPSRSSKTDERYSKASFMRARAHFLSRTVLKETNALIWGAGKTGLMLCRFLSGEGADVSGFIDIDPRKIGNIKAGKPVHGPERAASAGNLILVAVASRGARGIIRDFLDGAGKREGMDYLCVT